VAATPPKASRLLACQPVGNLEGVLLGTAAAVEKAAETPGIVDVRALVQKELAWRKEEEVEDTETTSEPDFLRFLLTHPRLATATARERLRGSLTNASPTSPKKEGKSTAAATVKPRAQPRSSTSPKLSASPKSPAAAKSLASTGLPISPAPSFHLGSPMPPDSPSSPKSPTSSPDRGHSQRRARSPVAASPLSSQAAARLTATSPMDRARPGRTSRANTEVA